MYTNKEVSRKFLSAGLFHTAYSLDAARGDRETVFRLFIFCAAGLAHLGEDPATLLEELETDDIKRAGGIMDTIDAEFSELPCDAPDLLMLMSGLQRLLGWQFPEQERHDQRKFLADLAELVGPAGRHGPKSN